MSRQDKATSERHTRTLRELIKRPENKVCADCKRNDPRWASWNLGVFLCIRCSGIHRGMGTHISKIKSVDLDIWTPEQMDSIQKWGNARANLFWEAHLKPGHIPAEHKMESFIRSKYESRRWALEGPLPRDPSVLESAREHHSLASSPPGSKTTSTRPPQAAAPAQQQSDAPPSIVARQKSQDHAQVQSRPPGAAAPVVPGPTQTLHDDLFSLDFHAPASPPTTQPDEQKKPAKNEILSLFASPPPPRTGVMTWGGFSAAQAQAYSPTPMGGPDTSTLQTQSGWDGMQARPYTRGNLWNQQPDRPQHGVWVQQQQHQQTFGGLSGSTQSSQSTGPFTPQNVWGGDGVLAADSGPEPDLFSSSFMSAAAPQPPKKDDAFGDLWGGFK